MRDDDVAALQEPSTRTLEWAHRELTELGEYIRSIQDSYFAAFYAAKAALIHLGIRSKGHQSVQDRIDALVDQGVVSSNNRGVLEQLLDRRNEAAYRFARADWTEEEAAYTYRLAEKFTEEMVRVCGTSP